MYICVVNYFVMRNSIVISLALLSFVSCAKSVSDGTVEEIDAVSYSIVGERDESDGLAFVKTCVSELYKGLTVSPQGFFQGTPNGMDGFSEGDDDIASQLGLPSEEKLISALLGGAESSPAVKSVISDLNFKIVKYEYETVDQYECPIVLSSVLAVPYKTFYSKDIDSPTSIVIDCHSTITSNDEAPTNNDPYSFLWAVKGSLVVCPDYLGFGCSLNFDQQYLCNEIGARQVLDAVRAAVKLLKEEYYVELSKDYYTAIIGYGQGGTMAAAVAREIERMSPEETEQFDFRLRRTFCGGAPFDLRSTACWYLDVQYPRQPSLVPLTLKGLMSAYEYLFDGISYEDYFSEEYLSSGIDDLFSSPKSQDIDGIDLLIDEKIETYGLRGIVSAELYDDYERYRNGDAYGRLLRPLLTALDRNTLFSDGWIPSHPIVVFHVEGDDVVPFLNYEYAVSKLMAFGCDFPRILGNSSAPVLSHKAAEYAFYITLLSAASVDGFDE